MVSVEPPDKSTPVPAKPKDGALVPTGPTAQATLAARSAPVEVKQQQPRDVLRVSEGARTWEFELPDDSSAYEVATFLSREIGMGEGTIYPLMRRMQAEGLLEDYLVESPSGPPRRYYGLTRSGRARLQSQRDTWQEFSRSIDRIVRSAR
jgi:PadR family transcriptional regulator PadR